jgi:hypothetical protein
MLGFSDRAEPAPPGTPGPSRLTRDDIAGTFAGALRVDSIEPATIEITLDPAGIPGWFVAMTREPEGSVRSPDAS